ncbi:MAG TPA: adenylate/guanylate cyclase domain-containing protein [Pseudomonadales bacterium]|nr:adenylate/guanylate cyclase domain-containing protein [Pseudomonadales bacterium]
MDKHFQDLLLEYAIALQDENRKAIEQTLWRKFGTRKAVFVLDMSGFSVLSQRFGIVHYLSMVRRMQLTAQPVIEQFGGEVVKFEADNCFAAFPDVLPAIQAATALNAAFFGMNLVTPDEFDIRVSVGIDYGDILLIGGPDYFGDPVNCASKLGEDTAEAGEILVTQRAFDRVPADAGIQTSSFSFRISGIELQGVKIEYAAAPQLA